MEKNGKMYTWVLIVALFALLFMYSTWKETNFRKKIELHKAFSEATFKEIKATKGSGTVAKYFFVTAKDSLVENWATDGRFYKLGRLLFEKKFPVIYDSSNPANSKILLFENDFLDFGLQYPDSLKWTEEITK